MNFLLHQPNNFINISKGHKRNAVVQNKSYYKAKINILLKHSRKFERLFMNLPEVRFHWYLRNLHNEKNNAVTNTYRIFQISLQTSLSNMFESKSLK